MMDTDDLELITNTMRNSKKHSKKRTLSRNAESIVLTIIEEREFGDLFQPFRKEYITDIMRQYIPVFNAIHAAAPNWSKFRKVDWAINYILRPDFFKDSLASRLNNTMLVAALLVTISGSSFMSPIESDSKFDSKLRCWSYCMFFSTCFFLGSIFLGVFFSEHCLSRNYTESDRFFRIISNYHVFVISQHFMFIGTLLLVFGLIISSSMIYIDVDTGVFAAFLIAMLVTILIFSLILYRATESGQNRQVIIFMNAFCDEKGGMRQEFINWLEKQPTK